MRIRPIFAIFAGGALVASVGYFAGHAHGEDFLARTTPIAAQTIVDAGGEGISANFVNRFGSPTRHAVLHGGEGVNEKTRARVAQAVSRIEGVGGIFWADGTMMAESDEPRFNALHCQEDVESLLRTRTIRFEGGSSELEEASQILLDEVAAALRPCLGSIIAITGHTDNTGPEPGNLALSRERAATVRNALVARGIPRDGLRASGVGSSTPVEGLDPSDPANRRIEFSVIATEPLVPTPVDTPGAR